jgi:hypothetical protein
VAVLVLGAAGVFAAQYAGLVVLPNTAPPSRVLVIGTAPDEENTELAVFAFSVNPSGGEVTVLDTLAPVTVSGTSAKTPRDAFPFGGGAAVAESLALQTGGEPLPWVVLHSDSWAAMVDAAGGLTVQVPEEVGAYSRGTLTQIDKGTQLLSGSDAVALAGAIRYMGSTEAASRLLRSLGAGVSAVVADPSTLSGLAASRTIDASSGFRLLATE